jgi:hypothetical protein
MNEESVSTTRACPDQASPHFSDIWTDAQHSRTAFIRSYVRAAWRAAGRSLKIFSRHKKQAEPQKISRAFQSAATAVPSSFDQSESQVIPTMEINHWFLSYGG